MPAALVVELDEQQRLELQRVARHGAHWRERQRAETILLLARGLSTVEVAQRQELNKRTVMTTRRGWLDHGPASLSDLPRSGAPCRLDEAQVQRLLQWARSEPLSSAQLLSRHIEAGGEAVHVDTIKHALQAAGFVWKRTRHSLCKKETPAPSSKAVWIWPG
ncbi:helix-turn-helix domain-containing protein [Caldimonas tepidiphila]|uniref:helix-turn-helix domain-containing protein n=1 Tax=Caldimonas tepidiphila TaxID=2315841 RepID=UPI000E5B2D8B|nr:helix-turn-helix domain-containing protein [Caldimonas tepidiphila]